MGEGRGLAPYAEAETQYSTAKTSVWWDIDNCQVPKGCNPNAIAQNISSALVRINYAGPLSISAYGDTTRIAPSLQHALSSTGISLNHVPTGVKDASDKKILVDMLFWAVDNPAPANYLLISSDRDFSNALHQLRMRRYNILLAQPHNTSASLVSAAKSVWLWNALLAGAPPLTNAQSQQLSNKQLDSGNRKLPFDSRHQGKTSMRNPSKTNGHNSKAINPTPFKLKEIYSNINSFQPGNYNPTGCGFTTNSILGNPDQLWSNNGSIQGNHENSFLQPLRSNSFPLQQNGDFKLSSRKSVDQQNGYPHASQFEPTSFTMIDDNYIPESDNGIGGSPERPKPSEHIQGLIGVVLLALNKLKTEKIMPTESNIADCIQFGDPKHQSTDVKKALESAIEQQMVVKQSLGTLQLYVGKKDKLWKCVNPVGGNPNKYSNDTWDEIQKFLSTASGRSAIMGTKCKYEAGIVIKNMCFKKHALGEVLHILNMAIAHKKWIVHHQSGWQPLKITLPEVISDSELIASP